jgi:plastocyanin
MTAPHRCAEGPGPFRSCAWALAWAVAVASPSALAATLTVHVVAPDGQPAPGVVVELVMPAAAARAPAEPVVIAQLALRFVPQVTAVPVGTTIRFTNQDSFDHHLRSQPAGPLGIIAPAKDFEFRMPGARAEAPVFTDVRFDRAGLVVLGCHLHNAMRGYLYVAESALLGVTDAAGKAVIQSLPDGRAELRTWHPQQLSDQVPSIVQVAGDSRWTATLNFRPAPARQPRR